VVGSARELGSAFACLLVLTAGCGDRQDESSRTAADLSLARLYAHGACAQLEGEESYGRSGLRDPNATLARAVRKFTDEYRRDPRGHHRLPAEGQKSTRALMRELTPLLRSRCGEPGRDAARQIDLLLATSS